MLALALGKLVMVQAVDVSDYAAKSQAQRIRTIPLVAQRGSITDQAGKLLAFSVEGRAVAARPALFTTDAQRERVADVLVADVGGDLKREELLEQLRSDRSYVYLARGLMPAQADLVMEKFSGLFDDEHIDAIALERQDLRQDPGGSVMGALIGGTDYDSEGTSGIESKFNTKLSGKEGSRTVDVDARGQIIPGSAREERAAVNGMNIALTIDADLQYTATEMLRGRVEETRAKSGCIIMMTIREAHVAAMACYEPGKSARETGNRAVTDKIEPGSVNKVVTFAAALEQGLVKPDTVMTVDGQIPMGGITVHDAWGHGPIDMTGTGILAKSSNVGTLMLAQKVGEDTFLDYAKRFGQGDKTGIQLPGESSGKLPERSTWSSSTFANLPIGQGVAVTLVQLAGMYQAIANDGVRIAPTIVASTTVDGVTTPTPLGAPTTVMKPETADTLREMLRGTVQDGDVNHRGTAPAAAITGYQVAGKTGTAQKVDEEIQDYSQTKVTSTFAGIVPADAPRYSVAIMLDEPQSDGPGGTSAAPLFHNVAAYAMRHADVPPSAAEAPIYDLYVN